MIMIKCLKLTNYPLIPQIQVSCTYCRLFALNYRFRRHQLIFFSIRTQNELCSQWAVFEWMNEKAFWVEVQLHDSAERTSTLQRSEHLSVW